MTTLLDMISRLTSNELLLRRWLGIFTSPQLADLADAMLGVQGDLDQAREELWVAIRTMVLDLAQAAAVAFPDIPFGSSDTAVEMIFALVVAHRRNRREEEEESKADGFRLVIQPLDGGTHDEEHLEIVARASVNGLPVNGAWQDMAAQLAACTRPAIVWAPDNEIQFDLDEDDDETPEADSDSGPIPFVPVVPPPVLDVLPAMSCRRCVPLGPTRDEDGALCSLYLCGCANDGTILVESLTRPPRAVPCSLVRTAPSTSPAPQVEGLRRSDAAGLTRAP